MGLLDFVSSAIDPKFQITQLSKPTTLARGAVGGLIDQLPTKSRDNIKLARAGLQAGGGGLIGKFTRVPTVIKNIL